MSLFESDIVIDIVGSLVGNFFLVGMRGGGPRILWENFRNLLEKIKFCVKFVDVSFRTYQYFEENFEENITRKK